jgi:hypothetical protein
VANDTAISTYRDQHQKAVSGGFTVQSIAEYAEYAQRHRE